MKKTNAARTTIADLPRVGTELPDEHLQLATGGLIIASYQGACCTVGNDTDYRRVD